MVNTLEELEAVADTMRDAVVKVNDLAEEMRKLGLRVVLDIVNERDLNGPTHQERLRVHVWRQV